MQPVLITIGATVLILGLVWPFLGGLGRLPGDIRFERPGFSFFAPMGSSLLISIVLSLVLTVLLWFWRR